jgi:hypothetical protein
MADDFEARADEIDQELSGSVAEMRSVRERLQTLRADIVRRLQRTICPGGLATGADGE